MLPESPGAGLEQRTRLALLTQEVTYALIRSDSLQSTLQRCAQALVTHLDAAFARIWTLDEQDSVLELQASAGIYTHLDGGHARVPVGQFKIGRIAEERLPHLTNDVQNDDRIGDPEWARREGMVAFAGYPLIVHDRLLGVMAMFAQRPLEEFVLEAMSTIAREVALGIETMRSAQALRDSEELHRTVIESAKDLISTVSLDGTITSVNAAFEATYGWPRDAWIGKSSALLVHREDLERAQEALQTTCSGEFPPVFEIRILHKSGEYVPTEFVASPFRANGRIVGALVIARDLSARHKAERALDDSRRELGAFLDNSPAAMWMMDEDGRLVLGNKPLERLFARRLSEVMGRTARELFPPGIAEDLTIVNQQIVRDGTAVESQEVLPAPDGTTRTYNTIRFPVFDQAGAVRGVGGISTDISERVEAQKKKEDLESQLHRAQKLETVGQLAGGIAHDFNNILAVILNYAEFAQEELPDGSPIKDDVLQVQIAAQKAVDLVQRLLIFSLRDVTRPEPVDLNAQVVETGGLLTRTIGENIELRLKLADGLPPVNVDPSHLEQVILNLAANASDAMPRGGVLEVETALMLLDEVYAQQQPDARPGEYVRLSVSDTGEGMVKEVLHRAFEPFFTTKEKATGTGLGLATVYGIVRGAAGHVTLYSEVGLGTTVNVYLPVAIDGQSAEGPTGTMDPLMGHGETILVVEDEPAVRELTCRILKSNGYHVLQAKDAATTEAVCAQHGGGIELLLTDVVMPGASGMQLSKLLGEKYPSLQRLYMSGYARDVLAQQGPLDGPLLTKPFTQTQLLEAVREGLDGAS